MKTKLLMTVYTLLAVFLLISCATRTKTYTIIWENYDGTVLKMDSVEEDEIPFYNGEIPVKPASETYEYTFIGWSPEISPATSNQVYVAQFSETEIIDPVYTITWKNYDGIILGVDEVAKGKMPIYAGRTPVKPSTETHEYFFTGWFPEVVPATADQVYTAQFDESEIVVLTYTITWKNDDGTTLKVDQVKQNETPIYSGITPTKLSTEFYEYTFIGWSPEISRATADQVYTAQFSETEIIIPTYTITWKNDNGTVLKTDEVEENEMPFYDGEKPIKPATETHEYTFVGWLPKIVPATADQVYEAQFSETEIMTPTYTITWKNDDGTILQEEEVEKNKMPVYSQNTPLKPATDTHEYTFIGWFPEVVPANADQVYTALFSETEIPTYTITWKNDDGTVLKIDEVKEMTFPIYDGDVPTKQATETHEYTFIGWSPDLILVIADRIYTAQFSETEIPSYTITWKNYDGTVLKEDNIKRDKIPFYEGDNPVKPKTETYTYEFIGWLPEIVPVTADQIYVAEFSETEIPIYTITWKNDDGTVLKTDEVKEGVLPIYNGLTPKKESEEFIDYIFDGWDNEIIVAIQDQIYTAVYRIIERAFPLRYILAKDDDFDGDDDGEFVYIGDAEYVIIPEYIKGVKMTKTGLSETQHIFMEKPFIKGIAFENALNIVDMSYLFFNNNSPDLELEYLDTSAVINMSEMFAGSQATTLDLSSFVTSSVESMFAMFADSEVTTLDLNSFDTSNVDDMGYMFAGSQAISLDLNLFDTSNVVYMDSMFANSQATTLNLSSFNTSKVHDMSAMFAGSYATTLDLSLFDTSNVIDMGYMFAGSQTININVSSFNTSNVIYMDGMFKDSQATTLDLRSFDTSQVINRSNMFTHAAATLGYARNLREAAKFNEQLNIFIVKTVIVIFDSNEGTAFESQEIYMGELVTDPGIPIKDGFGFVEWRSNGETFDFNTEIYEDITLVAHWLELNWMFNFEYSELDDSYTLTESNHRLVHAIIPETYNDKPVRRIGNDAFNGPSSIKTVFIPNSVTSIGQNAFSGMSSLISIFIPNSVTIIEKFAFAGSQSVTSVTFEKDSQLTTIEEYGFANMTSLKSFIFEGDSQLTIIKINAFYQCSSLTHIDMPSTLTTIEDYAFAALSSLTKIVIPQNVTTIGSRAFMSSDKLTIYSEVETQQQGWDSLWNFEDRPVYWLGQWQWIYDENGYLIPDGATINVTFDCDGGSYIEPQAIFKGSKVVEPNIPTKVGFEFILWELDGVIFDFNTEIYEDITLTAIWEQAGAFIYEYDGLTDSYTLIGYLGHRTNLSIPKEYENKPVTGIGKRVFERSNIVSVFIPNTVVYIGDEAFSTCRSLTTVIFEADSQLTHIGENVFDSSTITSIDITSHVESIDISAFFNTDKLTYINVAEDNNYFSSLDGVLYNKDKTKLIKYPQAKEETSFIIPNSVTHIEPYAFGTENLTIYAEVTEAQPGWDSYWNYLNRPVYWLGQWHYDENGNPTPNL